MKSIKSTLSLLLASLFAVVGTLNAQNKNDEESLKNFIKKLYEGNISNENVNLLSDDFKNMFSLKFTGVDVDMNMNGEVKTSNMSLEDYIKDLQTLRKSSEVNVDFKVKEINMLAVKGKSGLSSFLVDFQILKNGEVITRGDQAVSLLAVKNGDSWKVLHLSQMYVESEVFAGTCYCDIFYSQDSESYASFLTIPNGDRYETANDRFKVLQSGSQRVIRMNGSEDYDWNSTSGDIRFEGKVIGNSKSPQTAIRHILRTIHPERCQKITSK